MLGSLKNDDNTDQSSGNACVTAFLNETLHKYGSAKKSIVEKLTGAAKGILLQRIQFIPAQRNSSHFISQLKAKYSARDSALRHCLKTPSTSESSMLSSTSSSLVNVTSPQGLHGFVHPQKILYPPERLQLEWSAVRRIGSGLANLGNTCFLNSTLQCLSYTVPLVNYLLKGEHRCSSNGNICALCEMYRHIQALFKSNSAVIKPLGFIRKLRFIANNMQLGRQEDAHEFLRYLIDSMQKCALSEYDSRNMDPSTKQTTIIHQIFGGYIRSQVRCLKCNERSNTFDPILDLCLDLKNAGTLERALHRFILVEKLDSENAYKCSRCGFQPACKQITIARSPTILTIQLKRFDYHKMFGSKVTRQVEFPAKLNIRPYMSTPHGSPILYELYAVLVHDGFSCNSGHYYAYVKNSNSAWFLMNDSNVRQVGIAQVLAAQAYLLFYQKSAKTISSSSGHQLDSTSTKTHLLHTNRNQSLLVQRPFGKFSSATSHLHTATSSWTKMVSNETPAATSTPAYNKLVECNGNSIKKLSGYSSLSNAESTSSAPAISSQKQLEINSDISRKKSFQSQPKAAVPFDVRPRIILVNGLTEIKKKEPQTKLVNSAGNQKSLVPYNGVDSSGDEHDIQTPHSVKAKSPVKTISNDSTGYINKQNIFENFSKPVKKEYPLPVPTTPAAIKLPQANREKTLDSSESDRSSGCPKQVKSNDGVVSVDNSKRYEHRHISKTFSEHQHVIRPSLSKISKRHHTHRRSSKEKDHSHKRHHNYSKHEDRSPVKDRHKLKHYDERRSEHRYRKHRDVIYSDSDRESSHRRHKIHYKEKHKQHGKKSERKESFESHRQERKESFESRRHSDNIFDKVKPVDFESSVSNDKHKTSDREGTSHSTKSLEKHSTSADSYHTDDISHVSKKHEKHPNSSNSYQKKVDKKKKEKHKHKKKRYKWVEMETPNPADMTQHIKKPEVPLKKWNETPDEKHKTSTSVSSSVNASSSGLTGIFSSFRRYGDSVTQWDGSESALNLECEKDAAKSKKRARHDLYDEELDRGHEKKKKKRSYDDSRNHNRNPFQDYQTAQLDTSNSRNS